MQAYPASPFPQIYDTGIFGVGRRTDPFRNLSSKSVSLPFRLSHQRLDCGQFRQEPAIAELDWLFTPSPRLEEQLYLEPLQAFTGFYPRFTLPRVRSPSFGSHLSNWRRFHTSLLASCEHFGFPTGPLLDYPCYSDALPGALFGTYDRTPKSPILL
jgi:hypothetical protein